MSYFRTEIISNFNRTTAGSVTLFTAVSLVVLLSLIGAGVDYSRWHNARSRTLDALDAALLSAARALQTSESQDAAIAVAQKSFLENARQRLQVKMPSVSVTISEDGTMVEGVANGKVSTPFLSLIRVPDLEVAATSRVGFGIGGPSGKGGSDLEISMMLDVTGSMCDDESGPCTNSTKLDALKQAATDLISIIMKSSTSSSTRIALVPFATYIRVGDEGSLQAETFIKKTTNQEPSWSGWYKECTAGSGTASSSSESWGSWTCTAETTKHAVNWKIIPCLTERTGPAQLLDSAPGPNDWLNTAAGNRFPLSWDSSETPIGPSADGTSPAGANYLWNYSSDGKCWEADVNNAMMPLTSDKEALLDRINGLVAYGATAGGLGTQWTWYTLSPNWSLIWPDGSSPGPYSDTVASGGGTPKLRKIAVLMTDGLYNAYRSWKDQDPVQISEGAKQLCANMKEKGIEIYTVGFDLDSLSPGDKERAIDTLQTCGTDLQHFYEAVNAEQLKQSFRDIAMQLAQIYIAR